MTPRVPTWVKRRTDRLKEPSLFVSQNHGPQIQTGPVPKSMDFSRQRLFPTGNVKLSRSFSKYRSSREPDVQISTAVLSRRRAGHEYAHRTRHRRSPRRLTATSRSGVLGRPSMLSDRGLLNSIDRDVDYGLLRPCLG